MGGAERGDRKRRQQASAADAEATVVMRPVRQSNPASDAQPKGGQGKSPMAGFTRSSWSGGKIALAVVLAVLGAVVVATVVITLSGRSTNPVSVAANYPVRVEGAVVVAGQSTARTTVDVYEDYLCPACALFEEKNGAEITQALNDSQIQVRYHNVAILSGASDPPGYSVRAGNAAICSASAGVFPTYHARLFAEQPAEGSAGKSDDELVALGKELLAQKPDAQGEFESCVRSGKHASEIEAETKRASGNPALRGSRGFGTPTVTVGGQRIDTSNENWVREAIQRP